MRTEEKNCEKQLCSTEVREGGEKMALPEQGFPCREGHSRRGLSQRSRGKWEKEEAVDRSC